VAGETSPAGGEGNTACEVLPSSQGSLLIVVPGASFVGLFPDAPILSEMQAIARVRQLRKLLVQPISLPRERFD
jgi:hypothetical protein